MKLLQFNNQSLMMLVRETAIIKSPVVAGSTKDITADDNNGFSADDFVLAGEIAKAKSEIFQVSAAVVAGTTIQADTLVFPHNAGTPLYRIPYNQVKFYRATTLTGDKTLLDTVDIDADNEYTTLKDTTNTTGFLFFTLYNSETTDESTFSAGYDYGTISYGSRIKIREFVSSPNNWSKPLDGDLFNTLCDSAEAEIFAIKRWKFREATVSFNSVEDQQSYDSDDMGVSDIGQILYATYDGNPVLPMDMKVHKNLNWNVLTTGTPRVVQEWNGALRFTPIPSEDDKVITINYYKNSSGFANETTESEVRLPMAIGFRVLQDLWATVDMKKSQYFERRYLQLIQAMRVDDIKQVSKFPALTDSVMDKMSIFDQVDNPTIT